MKNRNSKRHSYIAPIVVTILTLLYFAFYFSVLWYFIPSVVLRVVFIIIPVCLSIGMIVVCIQRIKEIKGGETDDLSKF